MNKHYFEHCYIQLIAQIRNNVPQNILHHIVVSDDSPITWFESRFQPNISRESILRHLLRLLCLVYHRVASPKMSDMMTSLAPTPQVSSEMTSRRSWLTWQSNNDNKRLNVQPIVQFIFITTGMSFCRGSVNCHGSDGKMYHFCESSKSLEIFTGVEGGGWVWWSPRHIIN